jgi:hypothetical protein
VLRLVNMCLEYDHCYQEYYISMSGYPWTIVIASHHPLCKAYLIELLSS